jgi:hypothetical protein
MQAFFCIDRRKNTKKVAVEAMSHGDVAFATLFLQAKEKLMKKRR